MSFEMRNDLEEPVEIEFVYDLYIENEIKKANDLFIKNVN
jgi:hypothetical protein